MKAIQCSEFGPPENLAVSDVPDPEPGPREVLIRVRAAGAGFVDGLLVQGLYQVKPPLPYIPGTEYSGEIVALGEGAQTHAVGDNVIVSAFSGGFAELATAPEGACTPLPKHMTHAEAAGFLLNHCTALYGFQTCGNLKSGEAVLILGAAGGVGSAAMSVAKTMGARVIAAASSSDKRDYCLANGADEVVDYTQEDWRADLKDKVGEAGLNLVYDPVGGELSEPAFRSLAPGGRHLVVGFAAGSIPSLKLNLALLKRSSLVGVDWGGYVRADPKNAVPFVEQLGKWIESKELKIAEPTVRSLNDAGKALREMLDRKTVGKVIIVP